MISLSERQRAALEGAASDRREFSNRTERTFLVDGEDYTDFVTSLRYEADEDAPACLLTATLSIRLPNEGPESVMRREGVLVFTVLPDGDETSEDIVGFRGAVVSVTTARGRSEVVLATAGHHVSRSLKRTLDLVNVSPAVALYDALAPLPYRGYELDAPDEPLLTRTGGESFRFSDTHADIVSLVEEEARVIVADSQENVARCYLAGEIPSGYVWEIEEGRDTRALGDISTKVEDESKYASVVVYKTSRIDGSQVEVARAAVENHGADVDPDDTYDIEYSDEEEARHGSAWALAFAKAERIGRAPVMLRADLIYWPFPLTRGDGVLVTTREISVTDEEDGEWTRRYLMRLDGFANGPSLSEASIFGAARLLSREWVPREAALLDGIEATSANRQMAWGYDHAGRVRFDAVALDWADSVEGEGGVRLIRLDTEKAGRAGVRITRENGRVKVAK